MISNTDYSTDTSSDATDSRGYVHYDADDSLTTATPTCTPEPKAILLVSVSTTRDIKGAKIPDFFDGMYGTPAWRIRQIDEQIKTRQTWKRKPITQPQRRPRPLVVRKMMFCDRRD